MSELTTITTGKLPWREYQLAWEQLGPNNGPPILLVHGLFLDAGINRDLARALAREGYRVILLDLLGHGHSDKPTNAKELRLDLFGDQMREALDYFELEKAVVGGVSLGSLSALHFAAAHPQRCTALLLEMPVLENALPAAALMLVPLLLSVRLAQPVYRQFARLMRRMPRPRRDAIASVMDALSAEPEVIAAILHGVLFGPVAPSRADRMKITAPSLVIGHAGDMLHALSDAKVITRELPNAHFILAKSVGELRFRPKRLMPKILDFLHKAHADQPTNAQSAHA